LKIKIKLAKDPAYYAENNPHKKIGMLLGAKAGDIIWYFKTDKDVSINPEEISIYKYKEMLISAVKDALDVSGYGIRVKIESEIFDMLQKPSEDDIGKSLESAAKRTDTVVGSLGTSFVS
jgi:hypothetical protein